jgi:hypothetical protein
VRFRRDEVEMRLRMEGAASPRGPGLGEIEAEDENRGLGEVEER